MTDIEIKIYEAKKARIAELKERIVYAESLIDSYNEDYDKGILSDGEIEVYDILTENYSSDCAELSGITY